MKVNGNHVALDQKQTLLEFLTSQGLNIDTIAVEYNGEILSKESYSQVLLSEDDTLEIVRFVGGG